MSIRLGYACINTKLREQGIFSSRSMVLKTLTDSARGGVELARKLAIQNIQDTKLILQWNEQNGIRFFRLTSELFPHLNNHLAGSAIADYKLDFALHHLHELGAVAKRYGHRITAHPGQFVQLGTPREEVLERSKLDLKAHADIFTALGLTPTLGSVMVLHGGGVYGNKQETMARWCAQYMALPEYIRQYIVLENDEYSYGVLDLLPWCEKYDIPLVIDWFHNICYRKIHANKAIKAEVLAQKAEKRKLKIGTCDAETCDAEACDLDVADPQPVDVDLTFGPESTDIIERIMAIWRRRGIKPKCHYSEQADDMRVGTHSDFISEIPSDILRVCVKYDIDIMCECKQKQACMIPLLAKHFDKNVSVVNDNEYVYYTVKPQYMKK
ncbi:UV DNA damage endonuclease [Faustovirus]|nr:UV DNA damage endonuclease [Faustovirus]AMN84508.1 UV DNA damage endonuclease [Faustovirus]AMP44350.1 UV DNA damage endonuclease [Faustovirus]